MNKIEGTLMEVVKDKPYTFAGKSGVSSSLLFRPKGQNTRIMKFKGNTDDKTLWSDATELLDKEVVIGFDLFPGEGMAASVRLVSISEA